jgi:predicted AAA+ superfamily ATPase
MKEKFSQIIIERQDWIQSIDIVPREIAFETRMNYVFTGLRRAGKSYVLYQIMQQVFKKIGVEHFLMINFEDERLIGVQVGDLQYILDAYRELYDYQPIIFLDEIQNVEYWQKYVRRLADEGYQVFVTGSNAEMLSSEVASTLGGRFINKEILPLSFNEFLQFHGFSVKKTSKMSKERFEIIKHYEDYLKFGGFPELIKVDNKRDFLSSVYQKLFYGDLIARYGISNVNVLNLLVKKLAESVNNETSVNRIKNLIKATGLTVGNNTIFEYIRHLESSYLIASISNFYSKFVERESNKKYYFMDTGILNLFLMKQESKLLENQVYVELRRRKYEVYFLKRNIEVDFFVPDENLLIQVSYSIDDLETKKREVRSLQKAMKEFDIHEALIITHGESDTLEFPEGKITVVPAWQWLLGL